MAPDYVLRSSPPPTLSILPEHPVMPKHFNVLPRMTRR
jgi:hypothetical protein